MSNKENSPNPSRFTPRSLNFEEFHAQTREEWVALIERDLKGNNLGSLVWSTYEDFTVEPFYTAEDMEGLTYLDTPPGEFPFTRGAKELKNDWLISENISANTAEEANELALDGLARGLSSITFITEVRNGRIRGIPLREQAEMEALLKGIPIEEVPVNFKCGSVPLPMLALFLNEAQRRNVPFEGLSGSLQADPMSAFELEGAFPRNRLETFNELKAAIEFLETHAPQLMCISVGSAPFHDSGASAAQELAFTLASGVEYLSELTSMDLTADQVARRMLFSFSIGTTYFMEIAKLRAARLLWAKIVEQFHPKDEASAKIPIHASTSTWNQTVYDPYVNSLRTATEAMSAAIGGADLITISPFDEAFRAPDSFSRRIARNTQLIIKNESYFDRIEDPGAGSYYIEQLTDKIAEKAWEIFLSVEKNGGLIEALKSGYVQEEIERVRERRDKNIAARKDALLGTNQYPNPAERMSDEIQETRHEFPLGRSLGKAENSPPRDLERIMEMLKREGASVSDFMPSKASSRASDTEIEPLKPYRAAEAFEEIRLTTEAHAKKTGETPRVFLLPMGDMRMRKARANFSLNFFGCAGFEVIDNLGFSTVDEGVRAVLDSKAHIVVICGADGDYPEIVPEICRSIKERNNKEPYILLAGYPKEFIDRFKEAGVQDFITSGTDAVNALRKYQRLLGINKEAMKETAEERAQ